jgi:hypothetical protein
MNVLNLDVYMDVLCIGFVISAVLVILFYIIFLQHRLTYDGWGGPS